MPEENAGASPGAKPRGPGLGVRIAIVAVLVAAVIAVFVIRGREAPAARSGSGGSGVQGPKDAAGLPRLVDLGADKCIPCKAMAPILEKLREDYRGRFAVVFIDVWKDPAAGEKHGVNRIPTQIFFDAAGKELFRHTGFYSREDILGKWKELGFEFDAAAKAK